MASSREKFWEKIVGISSQSFLDLPDTAQMEYYMVQGVTVNQATFSNCTQGLRSQGSWVRSPPAAPKILLVDQSVRPSGLTYPADAAEFRSSVASCPASRHRADVRRARAPTRGS